MRSVGRSIAVAAVSVFVLLLGAQAAAAATRYAAPDGTETEPCAQSAPCRINRAVENASPGDQVVLAPGTYLAGLGLRVKAPITVGGQPGAPLPVINLGAASLQMEDGGATIHDMRLELSKETMGGPLEVLSGTAERIYADGDDFGGSSCRLEQGLIRDSVCAGFTAVDAAGPSPGEAKLVNVTAGTLLLGSFEGAKAKIQVINTIALPEPEQEAEVLIDVSENSSATIELSHSSFAKVSDTPSSGSDYTFTQPGTNGNITAPPLLANPAAGDYRELPTSPTIDAGVADPLAGALDLAGLARVQPPCPGAVPDIGAYELALGAPCPTAAIPISAPAKAKVKFGKLKRNLAKGTATLSALVSGPGKLVLTGKGLAKSTANPHGVETVKLKLKAKGKKLAKLQSAGAVSLKAKVTFTPLGSAPVTATKKLKLKLRPQR